MNVEKRLLIDTASIKRNENGLQLKLYEKEVNLDELKKVRKQIKEKLPSKVTFK